MLASKTVPYHNLLLCSFSSSSTLQAGHLTSGRDDWPASQPQEAPPPQPRVVRRPAGGTLPGRGLGQIAVLCARRPAPSQRDLVGQRKAQRRHIPRNRHRTHWRQPRRRTSKDLSCIWSNSPIVPTTTCYNIFSNIFLTFSPNSLKHTPRSYWRNVKSRCCYVHPSPLL